MTLTVTHNALELIEQFEGFSSTIYLDSGGVRTIGFGTTEADVSPLPTFLTRHQAELLLERKLQAKYLPPIEQLHRSLNDNQVAALLSFDYNLGPGIFQGTDVGAALRSCQFLAAANDFLEYDHANGVVLSGLLFRRREERRLFLEPPPHPTDLNHYLRFVDANFRFGQKGQYHWINERKTVELYDRMRIHPHLHVRDLHFVRADLDLLWKRIYIITHQGAKHGEKPNWDFCHRGYRLQQIKHRADGQRIRVDFQP